MVKRRFPDSEYRRVYMKDLVEGLKAVCDINGSEAKETATRLVQFMEAKLYAGEEVNLGFIKIQPRKVKPAEIKCNFDPEHKDRHFLGEGVRWRIHFIRSWLVNVKPPWSRY